MLLLFCTLHGLCQQDSIRKVGDPRLKTTGFRTFLIGKNYRREWLEPVNVPILDLKKLSIISLKEGGGKETRSLHVEGNDGKKLAFRSVEKFPAAAIPEELRNTLVEKLARDGLSASYPYGVLSMGALSTSARVPFLKNELVCLPDDSTLGEYQSKYKNSLVFMEDTRDPVTPDSSLDKITTISTEELVYELKRSNNRVDQLAVLRARLLDNFVMDFDRHEEQWDWYAIDSSKNKTYYPVPKDRDQVFFTNQGLLPGFLSKKSMLPELQGFKRKAKDITTFNRPALNFDRVFLNELSKEDWSEAIDSFLASMTDSVIEAAMAQQPLETQNYSAKKIAGILKEKRQYFKADMMNYYKFLSQTVSIVGANDRELYSISTLEHGVILIAVSKIDSSGNASGKLYERKFDPIDTREIRIYGLEGDDRFVVNGKKSKIKVRLIGGPGNDQFTNTSASQKVLVYDVKADGNVVNGIFKNRISKDAQNNTYTRLQTHFYNSLSPGIGFEYAKDGGIYAGVALKLTRLGFRKEPYGMHQTLMVGRALNNVSYNIRYAAQFIKVFGNTDLTILANSKLPTARTHFFGIGNNSLFDNTRDESYYLAHYDQTNISALLGTPLIPALEIKYGPVFQSYKLNQKQNEGKYISSLQNESNDCRAAASPRDACAPSASSPGRPAAPAHQRTQ